MYGIEIRLVKITDVETEDDKIYHKRIFIGTKSYVLAVEWFEQLCLSAQADLAGKK